MWGLIVVHSKQVFFFNCVRFKVAVHPRGPRKHCVISAYIFNEKSRVRLGTK